MTPEALRRRMAHGNIYPAEKIDAALNHYFRAGNLAALRELALLWLADKVDEGLQRYREAHDIHEHLGGQGAGRRRADRRTRGRDADQAGRQDRGPLVRRRPARRVRDQVGRPDRRRPSRAGRPAAAHRVARRQLPPGRRRRRARRAARVRQGGERHPARARRQPPRLAVRAAHRAGREPADDPRVRRHRRAHRDPRQDGPRPQAARPSAAGCPLPRQVAGYALAVVLAPLLSLLLANLRGDLNLTSDVLIFLTGVIARGPRRRAGARCHRRRRRRRSC